MSHDNANWSLVEFGGLGPIPLPTDNPTRGEQDAEDTEDRPVPLTVADEFSRVILASCRHPRSRDDLVLLVNLHIDSEDLARDTVTRRVDALQHYNLLAADDNQLCVTDHGRAYLDWLADFPDLPVYLDLPITDHQRGDDE